MCMKSDQYQINYLYGNSGLVVPVIICNGGEGAPARLSAKCLQ